MTIIDNKSPLINDSRRITFSENVKINMNLYTFKQRLLGCAVNYKGEDTYIKDVKHESRSYMDVFCSTGFKLLFENLEICEDVNSPDLKFYISDYNDETESFAERRKSIEVNYSIDKMIKNNPFAVKAQYDPEQAKLLRDEHDKVIQSIHDVTYQMINKSIEKLNGTFIRYNYADIYYIGRIEKMSLENVLPKFEQNKTGGVSYKYSYSDVLLKIEGLDKIFSLTDVNLSFIDGNKFYTFKDIAVLKGIPVD